MKTRHSRIAAAVPAAFLCSLLAAKCIRPIPASPPQHGLAVAYSASPAVASLFERACQDCHSNNTVWPWYSKIAPISWMVISDVEQGRGFLNLSNWNRYSKGQRLGFLASMAAVSSEERMPPASYTLLHPEARLSALERRQLAQWAKMEGKRLRSAGRKG